MTVYADVLLIVNCVMNSLILWCTAKLSRSGIKIPRIIAGGFIMAFIHGFFLLAVPVHAVFISVFNLLAGVGFTFRPKKIKKFLSLILLTCVVTFAVGGLGFALFYLTDLPYVFNAVSRDIAGFSRAASWHIPVICALSAYLCVKLCLRIIERFTVKRQLVYPVQVEMGEKTAHFYALIDTGHCLQEPITQSPVIVVEFEIIHEFLPHALRDLFLHKKENDLQSIAQRETSAFDARLRMIPFMSLGRAHGMLIGFKPDRVTVNGTEAAVNAVVGIYNNRLTRDGRYHGLVGPELIADII